MPTKRVQGRPVRGAGDVGREKLVEAARTILQIRAPQTISRKAVADAAGVTPALVSYYFPDKASLMSAATRPVIGERITELCDVLTSKASHADRLRGIVTLFFRLSDGEAHLIDLALDAVERGTADRLERTLLVSAYDQVRAFLREGIEAGAWRPMDVDAVLPALLGMCRSVSQMGRAVCPDGGQDGTIDPLQGRIDTVVAMIMIGLTPR